MKGNRPLKIYLSIFFLGSIYLTLSYSIYYYFKQTTQNQSLEIYQYLANKIESLHYLLNDQREHNTDLEESTNQIIEKEISNIKKYFGSISQDTSLALPYDSLIIVIDEGESFSIIFHSDPKKFEHFPQKIPFESGLFPFLHHALKSSQNHFMGFDEKYRFTSGSRHYLNQYKIGIVGTKNMTESLYLVFGLWVYLSIFFFVLTLVLVLNNKMKKSKLRQNFDSFFIDSNIKFKENNLLSSILSTPSFGIIMCDSEGIIRMVNQSLMNIFGHKTEVDLIGKSVEVLLPDHQQNAHKKLIDSYFLHPQSTKSSIRNNMIQGKSKQGINIPIELGIMPYQENGKKFGMAFITDLRSRNLIHEKLKRRISFYQLLLDSTPFPIVHQDSDGVYRGCNKAFLNLFEIENADIIGKTPKEFQTLEEIYYENDVISHIRDCQSDHNIELRYVNKHGELKIFQFQIIELIDHDKEFSGKITTITDVTSKKYEHRNLQLLAYIMDKSTDAILLVDGHTGKMIDFNNKAKEIYQCTANDLKNSRVFDIMNTNASDFFNFYKDLKMKQNQIFEHEHRRLDGNFFPVEVSCSYFNIDHDDLLVFLVRDITERKIAEEEMIKYRLLQSEKMATIGSMAAGIVHEIKNPLTIITAAISLSKKMIAKNTFDGTKFLKHLNDIENMTTRMNLIISGLQNLSHSSKNESFTTSNIVNLLEEAVLLCKPKLNQAKVSIRKSFPENSNHLSISIMRTQISQVIINLINNSCDALESLDDRWIEIKLEDYSSHVCIKVTDSGHGIPKDEVHKIFETFYTTKEVGKGTGLGLSLSQTIIKKHNGSLSIDVDNSNTCFIVELPKNRVALSA